MLAQEYEIDLNTSRGQIAKVGDLSVDKTGLVLGFCSRILTVEPVKTRAVFLLFQPVDIPEVQVQQGRVVCLREKVLPAEIVRTASEIAQVNETFRHTITRLTTEQNTRMGWSASNN